jgi:DNA-binding MarR family transcriptional regulator
MLPKRFEESLILRLITLGERLKRRRDIISQRLGVSTQQWLILLHLGYDPNIDYLKNGNHKKPLLPSELADALNVTRPNITNMINQLLEKGLIDQVEDGEDKRRKRLTLSEKGIKLLAELQPHREMLNSQLFGELSQSQQEQLLQNVEHCIKMLDNQKLF